MNYLELCQMVARESGTVAGNTPSSVENQSGRLNKVVEWTEQAWRRIQNRRNAWLWMRDEFEGTTTAGSARYRDTSFNIERWAAWITEPDTVTAYLQSTGVADEGPILFMPWSMWRRQYTRGVQQQGRPLHYTISPSGELCIGPTPDDTYVIRGEYRKTTQTLSENDDVPEMPERFHELIAYQALILLAEHDEAQFHIATFQRNYREMMSDLERDQLPEITLPGGLA